MNFDQQKYISVNTTVVDLNVSIIEPQKGKLQRRLPSNIQYEKYDRFHGDSQNTNMNAWPVAVNNEHKNVDIQRIPLFHDLTLNTLRPRQNGRHFPDDLYKCIFLNENVWILIRISLKFVPKGPINNNPALVQIMAWRRPGDKPLSGHRMENLLTHICVHSASMS